MLDTGRLSVAGIGASANPLLQAIWSAVAAYNSMAGAAGSGAQVKPRADALDKVAFTVGAYLTSKPPQPKMNNRKRWNALRTLAEQIGPEATRLGIRLLKGPSDYTKIGPGHADQSYWLERLDPQHRPGYVLSGQWEGWLNDPASIAGKRSFWDKIGTVMSPSASQQDVKYYPLIDPDELSQSRVSFKEDLLWDDYFDAPVDTEDMETHFSGKGWGIFVCSPDGKLFIHSHEAGVHHHSSFLAGGAVLAAGEIVVREGVVMVITPKSGHYQPTPENILNFVRKFRQFSGGAVVRPDLLDIKQSDGKVKFHWCWQLRDLGLKAPVLKRDQVLSSVPVFARSFHAPGGSGGFSDVLAKLPV
jgi:hypothetical protein